MEERPVRIGAGRYVAEPVIERREAPRDRRQHRHLLRRVAGHDLRVLIHRRLAPEFDRQDADEVGDEAVHRRRLTVARLVDGLLRLELEAVLLIEDPEQLRVDVRKLLTRIGIRRVHICRHPVGDDPVLRPVLCPIRDRVRQLLSDHALERRDLPRLVQAAQQVVERPVLEHDDDDVIQRVLSARRAHRNLRMSRITGALPQDTDNLQRPHHVVITPNRRSRDKPWHAESRAPP